jgi:hypothetical protein
MKWQRWKSHMRWGSARPECAEIREPIPDSKNDESKWRIVREDCMGRGAGRLKVVPLQLDMKRRGGETKGVLRRRPSG